MDRIWRKEVTPMTMIEEKGLESGGEAWGLMDLVNAGLAAQSIEELAEALLPAVTRMMKATSACLYVADARWSGPRSFQSQGFPLPPAELEALCKGQFERIGAQTSLDRFDALLPGSPDEATKLTLYPLPGKQSCLGLLGVMGGEIPAAVSPNLMKRLPETLANVLDNVLERAKLERQLSGLNTYMTVSSALAQSMDLQELMEISLYCCMEAVPVEAASILLLDEAKKNFNFYEVEGESKSVLMSATFPADRGIAGSVLKSQAAEIINDVSQDPRFYKRVDSETGFQTRNMIAIPLVAGEEEVGVMELLNKADGGPFLDEEVLLLSPLAEEIAFAIRNALTFEYVANTYCKQRQGLMSCKGCQRPLGSWTPCLKYREVSVWKDTVTPTDTLMMPRDRLWGDSKQE
jgi:hypothetical protein